MQSFQGQPYQPASGASHTLSVGIFTEHRTQLELRACHSQHSDGPVWYTSRARTYGRWTSRKPARSLVLLLRRCARTNHRWRHPIVLAKTPVPAHMTCALHSFVALHLGSDHMRARPSARCAPRPSLCLPTRARPAQRARSTTPRGAGSLARVSPPPSPAPPACARAL
jgi:hypothetical protein